MSDGQDSAIDLDGPAEGSKVCSECGCVYFSAWGHAKTCSNYPGETDGAGSRWDWVVPTILGTLFLAGYAWFLLLNGGVFP